jgi:hypothetical protein
LQVGEIEASDWSCSFGTLQKHHIRMMKVIDYLSLKSINSDPLVNNVVEICRDLECGCCTREENECRYAHHAPIVGEGDYVIFCTDHLHGKCECDSCR